MIYVDTRRPFWSASLTFPKFFGTMLLLGVAVAAAVLSWKNVPELMPFSFARAACFSALILGVLHAAGEVLFFRYGLRHPHAPAHRSVRTIWKLLRPQLSLRATFIAAATLAGIVAVLVQSEARAICATAFCLLTFGSAMIERYCFFTGSDAPRMPGGIAS
jgi:DMSO reductase anchor subunit